MNYKKLKEGSFLSNIYVYLDTEKQYSSEIFGSMRILPRLKKVYKNDENNLYLVLVKVRKKDEIKFIAAMEQLKNKALLMGTKGYLDMCERMQVLDGLAN